MASKRPQTVLKELEEAINQLARELPAGGELVVTWTVDIFIGPDPIKGKHSDAILALTKEQKNDGTNQ